MKMRSLWITIFFILQTSESLQEPRSNRNCEFKMVEKVSALEAKFAVLQETVREQHMTIKALQKRIADFSMSEWGEWATWSQCTYNCSNPHSGRTQARSRQAIVPGGNPRTQTENRPCNAVQFAGCVKDFGEKDEYGLAFSYKDEMAQATCTAMASPGAIYAVRRQCSSQTVSCGDICSSLGFKCFNALHVYNVGTSFGKDQTGKIGLQMHRYNSCSGNFCGPNFCCCSK